MSCSVNDRCYTIRPRGPLTRAEKEETFSEIREGFRAQARDAIKDAATSSNPMEVYTSLPMEWVTNKMDRAANRVSRGDPGLPEDAKPRDLINPAVAEILNGLHPNDRSKIPYTIDIKDGLGRSQTFEASTVGPDGNPNWHAVRSIPVGFEAKF